MKQFHQALRKIKHLIIKQSLEESHEMQIDTEELIDAIDALTFEIARKKDKVIHLSGIASDEISEFIKTHYPSLSQCEESIIETGKKLLLETEEIDDITKNMSEKIQKDEKALSNIIRIGKKKDLLNEES